MKRHIAGIAIISALLTGCNGDEIINITQIEAPKTEQAPLTFEFDNLSVFIDEDSPSNTLAGGSGTGNIVFTSSNTDIATVDALTGTVTLRDDGVVDITATKAGDSVYLTTSTQYQLTVNKYDRGLFQNIRFASDEYAVNLADSEISGNPFLPTVQEPMATTDVQIEANLPADNGAVDVNSFDPNNSVLFNASTSTTIYDSLGFQHSLTMYFLNDANSVGEWLMAISVDGEFYHIANADGFLPEEPTGANNGFSNHVGFNTFLQSPGGGSHASGVQAMRFIFDDKGDLIEVQSAEGKSLPTGIAGDFPYPISVPLTGLTTGADTTQTLSFIINTGFDQVDITQYAAPFEIRRLFQNGLGTSSLDESLVSYSSGNTDIALVDANTGALTLVGRGETDITATVAEDERFAEIAVSYRLVVN